MAWNQEWGQNFGTPAGALRGSGTPAYAAPGSAGVTILNTNLLGVHTVTEDGLQQGTRSGTTAKKPKRKRRARAKKNAGRGKPHRKSAEAVQLQVLKELKGSITADLLRGVHPAREDHSKSAPPPKTGHATEAIPCKKDHRQGRSE